MGVSRVGSCVGLKITNDSEDNQSSYSSTVTKAISSTIYKNKKNNKIALYPKNK